MCQPTSLECIAGTPNANEAQNIPSNESKKHTMKNLILILTILYSGTTTAQAPDMIPRIIEQLDFNPDECYAEFIVNKVLPYSPSESIVHIPTIVEEEEGQYFTLNTCIVLVDNETSQIKSRFYEPASIESDAIALAE